MCGAPVAGPKRPIEGRRQLAENWLRDRRVGGLRKHVRHTVEIAIEHRVCALAAPAQSNQLAEKLGRFRLARRSSSLARNASERWVFELRSP